MIDIIAREDGSVIVAHDLEDLPPVSELQIARQTGLVRAVLADGKTKELGGLQPSMLAMISDAADGYVVALDGWNVLEPYDCRVNVH